jgi:hypothetical protein
VTLFRAVIAALRGRLSKSERRARITDQSSIFLYELATTSGAVNAASIGAVILAILDCHASSNLVIWTVAATAEQAMRFRSLPWIITPRQRGAMVRNGDQYEFRDPESGYVWKVSVEALEG